MLSMFISVRYIRLIFVIYFCLVNFVTFSLNPFKIHFWMPYALKDIRHALFHFRQLFDVCASIEALGNTCSVNELKDR